MKMESDDVDRIHLSQVPVEGCFEHGNEPPVMPVPL
jgi:hypothetical protein